MKPLSTKEFFNPVKKAFPADVNLKRNAMATTIGHAHNVTNILSVDLPAAIYWQ